MSVLPERPALEHLRKQAKARRRERGIALSQAQHELAREYGFASWPKLVHAIQASQLHGTERALVLADPPALAAVLEAGPASATVEITGLPPLLVLLRRSIGPPADVRDCSRLLLDAGADPDSHTLEWGGEGLMSALFAAVERGDLALIRLLFDAGATSDEDAFYHACEQSDTALLDALHRPGFEDLVNHKLDFWTPEAGAISPPSTRQPCTAAQRPCSYSSTGALTYTTAPSTRTGLPRWTAPSGAYRTTTLRMATTPAPCRRCLPSAPRRGTNRLPATWPSTRY